MCKDFVMINNGKVIMIKGCFKKGTYVICLECGITKRTKKGKYIEVKIGE